MDGTNFSRCIIAGIGVFFGLATLGGFSLGFTLWNGDFIAIACLSSGVALSSYLWWSLTAKEAPNGLDCIVFVSFVLAAGLSLYVNLAWALWALKVPVSIGTVRDGHMAENYWLGPASLLYTIICYVSMKWQNRK
jgi:hypothetical protein